VNYLPTILVVDDEPSNIDILANVLEPQYDIQFALTGTDALHRMTVNPLPELILLDVVLPDISGFEVCQRLQSAAQTKGVPIIFVTSLATPEEEARGLDMGAVDFITKPISPAIVRARVRNHLEIKRTREQLERLTLTDSLTGIANRRHFDSVLAHEIERTNRTHAPLSLLLLDVDSFKAYNDHYGHASGDRCLQMIASTLREQIARPLDLVARVGGEEFACVLPATPAAGAVVVAERVRAAINQLAIVHATSPAAEHVTISGGVSASNPGKPNNGLALYQAADAALYRAKAGGRNCVMIGDRP
jgi:diguanylate cyclase (GGDEF)-like protein